MAARDVTGAEKHSGAIENSESELGTKAWEMRMKLAGAQYQAESCSK